MRFNVNHKVKVKLTEIGHKIHRADFDQLGMKSITYQPPQEDKRGWSEWQMWELMRLFGPHLYNGCNVPFETEIQIPKRPRC